MREWSVAVVLASLVAAAWGLASPVGRTVADLERALADWRLGCGECPRRFGWDGEKIALFTAGRLASLGFTTRLARSGPEWWVLVYLGSQGEMVVPVLPGLPPAEREGQYALGVFLGRIPWAKPGQMEARYLTPAQVLDLPKNAPPQIRIHWHPSDPAPGTDVWFSADLTDPDGTVIQVQWDFGDGQDSMVWCPTHAYGAEGTYTVTLLAVDDRGAVATARVLVQVRVPPPPPPGGGCPCRP